jgi:hypothetical protein
MFLFSFKLKEGTIVAGYVTEEEEDDSDVENNQNKGEIKKDQIINSEDLVAKKTDEVKGMDTGIVKEFVKPQ